MDQLRIVRSGNHFLYAEKTQRWILIDGPWFEQLTKLAISVRSNAVRLASPVPVSYIAISDENDLPVSISSDDYIIWHAIMWNNYHPAYETLLRHVRSEVIRSEYFAYTEYRRLWSAYVNSTTYLGFITGKGVIPCHINSYNMLTDPEWAICNDARYS